MMDSENKHMDELSSDWTHGEDAFGPGRLASLPVGRLHRDA